jgi:aryl-alcohol dehydrogenase-like predicted oxidoreductase
MDMYARKGYAYQDNFERLRRCEELAKKKGCTVPQIAMAWIFTQQMNMFAVVSTSKASRMQDNIAAMTLELTETEAKYLNLELGHL